MDRNHALLIADAQVRVISEAATKAIDAFLAAASQVEQEDGRFIDARIALMDSRRHALRALAGLDVEIALAQERERKVMS